MDWATRLDHFVENSAAAAAHEIKEDFSAAGHDVVNAARVGAVLAEGAYDYSVNHPVELAKTAVITIGTGALVGAAMALLPESLVLGAAVGIGGAALGAVGLTSMGVQTYDAFKESWPELKIVWDADHHTGTTVGIAEDVVKEKTGAVVANDTLLLPCFFLGNIAGNLGADAALAGKAATAAEAAVEGTTGGIAAMGLGASVEATNTGAEVAMSGSSGSWSAAVPALDEGAAAPAALAANVNSLPPLVPAGSSAAAAVGEVAALEPPPPTVSGVINGGMKGLWTYINHNPLEELPHPTNWMRLNNSNLFGFESNYWIEKADVDAVSSLSSRLMPGETSAAVEERGKQQG